MNCRILENRVFSDSVIDSILRDNFVEARLHTDGLSGPRKTRNLDLQSKLSSSVANPWLVVVDPNTQEPGEESGFQEADGMASFLKGVIK
ncbi:MAG: hypothetical protein ACI8Q9_002314 [Planctomycetota bacterium]